MDMPPWTYSKLDAFETCPRQFYHLRVAYDVPNPPGEAQLWGIKVHAAFEAAVRDGTPLPNGMHQWQTLAGKLHALEGEKMVEQRMALDINFQPSQWKTAWTRGTADLVILRRHQAAVLDYKTGRKKPTEQLDIYAGYVFQYHPQVSSVKTGLVWLKERRIEWKTLQRDDAPGIWQQVLPRVKKLASAYERNSWPARTSGLCKAWCPVLSCEFNGKKLTTNRSRNDA